MFLNTIRFLSDHKHLYYICGDFNINLGNLEVESNIKDYVNSIISLSCKLLISKPTRVSDHSATIIDHMSPTLMAINTIYYLAYLFLLLQNK